MIKFFNDIIFLIISLILISFIFLVPEVSASERSSLLKREMNCLALNIYFESRNQNIEGQKAVGFVTMNRVVSKRFPNSICKVVKQRKQFSWFSDGKSDTPREKLAWNVAKEVANYVVNNYSKDNTKGSLHYHALSVKPNWIKLFTNDTIEYGNHIFYTEYK